nr:hypothetical protein [Tanacetum cinerariifolium]
MRKSIRLRVRTGMKEVRHKLSACTSTVATNSQHVQDLRIMFHDMVSLLSAAEVFQKANVEGEKWEKNNPESPAEKKDAQHLEQTGREQDSGTVATIQGGRKKMIMNLLLKFLIPSPTTLMPDPPQYSKAVKMTLAQFTEHLSKTTSSIFSPTPPREPIPPRDEFKGKESQRIVLLHKELSKFLHNKMRKSIRLRVRTGMKEVRHKLSACTSTVATNSQHVQDLRIMFHDMVSLLSAAEVFQKANVEGEKWEKNNPESPAEKKDAQHLEQTGREQDSGTVATIQGTTSSIFSPTPPREPIPPRDEFKGKGIATEEPLKDTMPFMKGGSVPKISERDHVFSNEQIYTRTPPITPISLFLRSHPVSVLLPTTDGGELGQGPLRQEDVLAQLKEMKRLGDLEAEKEKSEESLKKFLKNSATIRAQKHRRWLSMRQKMFDEYNHQITHRANQLSITKISYRTKDSRLQCEWVEIHSLASKSKGKSNDLLLQSLRAKFEWVLTQAKALGIPSPHELSTFGLSIPELDRKRKKSSEYQEAMKGISECKASESNIIRRIRVKDIVKEVEDYLKTYSSARMDISWHIVIENIIVSQLTLDPKDLSTTSSSSYILSFSSNILTFL